MEKSWLPKNCKPQDLHAFWGVGRPELGSGCQEENLSRLSGFVAVGLRLAGTCGGSGKSWWGKWITVWSQEKGVWITVHIKGAFCKIWTEGTSKNTAYLKGLLLYSVSGGATDWWLDGDCISAGKQHPGNQTGGQFDGRGYSMEVIYGGCWGLRLLGWKDTAGGDRRAKRQSSQIESAQWAKTAWRDGMFHTSYS